MPSELKKHHKIVIGSFTSFLVILLIMNSVFIYFLFGKLSFDYNTLGTQIEELEMDSQSKFNDITDTLLDIKIDVSKLNSDIGSIDEEFDVLGEELDKVKASASSDFSGVIENAVESVATIRTDTSQGTGFFISDKGYLITNYHVVEGASAAGVFTYDGENHRVSLIGYNEDMDLALLKINSTYPELELGNSEDINIGEKVVAIGNPLGLQFSVSEGIVSAIDRPGPNGEEVYIQTDAALNPGNSGGPLINKEGEAIGINNFKINSGESLGFALEANRIKIEVNKISQEELEIDLL